MRLRKLCGLLFFWRRRLLFRKLLHNLFSALPKLLLKLLLLKVDLALLKLLHNLFGMLHLVLPHLLLKLLPNLLCALFGADLLFKCLWTILLVLVNLQKAVAVLIQEDCSGGNGSTCICFLRFATIPIRVLVTLVATMPELVTITAP